jgi:hypothetical protein
MDADVEETSDGEAEQNEDRELVGLERAHRSCRGSSGIGNNGDCLDTLTRPLVRSISYGVPAGS